MQQKKFSIPDYKADALLIIRDVWQKEVIHIKQKYYMTAGNWAPKEKYPTIHVAYLAPYIYELFSEVDSQHPWHELFRFRWTFISFLGIIMIMKWVHRLTGRIE